MHDYVDKKANITIEDVTTDDFEVSKGGWTGGVRTPDEFNIIMKATLDPVVQKGYDDEVGFKTENGEITNT